MRSWTVVVVAGRQWLGFGRGSCGGGRRYTGLLNRNPEAVVFPTDGRRYPAHVAGSADRSFHRIAVEPLADYRRVRAILLVKRQEGRRIALGSREIRIGGAAR